jgi:hypothetical protein
MLAERLGLSLSNAKSILGRAPGNTFSSYGPYGLACRFPYLTIATTSALSPPAEYPSIAQAAAQPHYAASPRCRPTPCQQRRHMPPPGRGHRASAGSSTASCSRFRANCRAGAPPPWPPIRRMCSSMATPPVNAQPDMSCRAKLRNVRVTRAESAALRNESVAIGLPSSGCISILQRETIPMQDDLVAHAPKRPNRPRRRSRNRPGPGWQELSRRG